MLHKISREYHLIQSKQSCFELESCIFRRKARLPFPPLAREEAQASINVNLFFVIEAEAGSEPGRSLF